MNVEQRFEVADAVGGRGFKCLAWRVHIR
jgi:hypothetical protein